MIMPTTRRLTIAGSIFLLGILVLPGFLGSSSAGDKTNNESLDWELPNSKLRLPFAKEQPIVFVGTSSAAEWNKLTAFWTPITETALDPVTGAKVERTIVKIKLPLGLSQAPKIPAENPLTVARWELGRRLYFDTVLSSDGTVACASCHQPKKGFTDQLPFSAGIGGFKGGMSAPTVMNSAYNARQFWDGRALSLEHQAQGPVENPVEMFDKKGTAWHHAVERVRKKDDYTKRFQEAFGTNPTRDAIAMAIACYERTVLNGNSIHDRAERAMRLRVTEEEGSNYTIQAKDYDKVLSKALAGKDSTAIAALGLDMGKMVDWSGLAAKLNQGRVLFFGKARCSLCHVGENFTDNQFHNLGVGVGKDGKLPADAMGRFAQLPVGHKNPEAVGAFKTPTLRGLVSTAPYMHNGSEKTLEDVVDFYDRGGNANEYLDPKMRDLAAEAAYLRSKATGTPYNGPEVKLFGAEQKPIIPSKLNLTKAEEAALVLFLRSLEGEVPAVVMGPDVLLPMPANTVPRTKISR